YTVSETGMSGVDASNYSTTVSGDASNGYTFTNTNTETVDISGTKVWDDADDQDGLRPESVTVSLLRNGTSVDTATVTADSAGTWSFSFEGLAKYDSDGNEYTYSVAEASVPDGYTSAVTDNEDGTFTITNTHTPETTSVSGTKTWDDSDDQDGLRPDSVTVSLLRDGTAVGTATATADSAGTWSFSFEDLAKYDSDGNEYTYSVAETTVPDGYTSEVTENEDGTFTITNTHTPETTSVSVTKEWVGPAGTSATFALYADDVDTGKTLTLSSDNNWTGSFGNLAKYNNGKEIAYTVSETGMSGVDASNYSTTVSGDASSGYTFTNTNTETVTIKVEKIWEQSTGREVSTTFRVYGNGERTETTLSPSATNEWTAVVEGLPKYDSNGLIEYTVVEEAVYINGSNENFVLFFACYPIYSTSEDTITCTAYNRFKGAG
ncbi:MAG: Cna B-type domain-containing protein, partial [Bilifractor sp.]